MNIMLQDDIFDKRFEQNHPTCQCGYFFEDMQQSFLCCPLYATYKTALLNFISPNAPFTIKTILYGCDNTNPNLNKEIYLETIRYIENTGRFTTN